MVSIPNWNFQCIKSYLKSYNKYLNAGFTSALLDQPFMLNEVPVEADIHDLYGGQENERARKFRRLVLSNEKVHQNIRNLLPVFDRRGLLD